MIRRALSALVVLVLLAGCGGAAGGEEGTAQLWVTRDRGAKLLVDAEVEAGQTLMRALASEADVETRYGGRYVQSVNGIEGSLGERHDWFWFVNGYEGDRSAASYTLRDGDVAWLDYRALAAGRRGARGRRRVPGAVRPRLRGEDARSGRPLRRLPWRVRRASRTGSAPTRSSRSGRPFPRVRMSSSSATGRDGRPAELLGETAGDPVRVVLSGNPDLTRAYEVP